MFCESSYPKNDLLKISKNLDEFSKSYCIYDDNEEKYNELSYELEKKCFIGFYFIRKLLESDGKVTDDIKDIEIEIVTYNFFGIERLIQPFGDWDEYNYEKPNKEKIKILNLTHLFIHSQIFFGSNFNRYESTKILDKKDILPENGLKFIYITSDKYIQKQIFEIGIYEIIKIFNLFGKNYVSSVLKKRDKNGKIVTICK